MVISGTWSELGGQRDLFLARVKGHCGPQSTGVEGFVVNKQ